ncbi:MAG: site-specific integrase [Cyclobacteriaceae bacterium]
MSTTVKLLLDKRRSKQDGTYPLIMRIIHNRKSANLPLGYSIKPNEWDTNNERLKTNSNLVDNTTRFNNNLQKDKSKAFDLISRLHDENRLNGLSATQLKGLIQKQEKYDDQSVISFIKAEIELLIEANRIGTARTYKDLINKLKAFTGREDLSFNEIDHDFLKKMEATHLKNGAGLGSLGVYMRTLRAAYNKAINSGLAKATDYPFRTYHIKKSEPQRRAISEDDLKKIITVDLKEGSAMAKARNYYLFSFFSQGMNWMDMCLLKYKNIEGDFERINYVRKKTGKPFSIKIFPKLRELLETLRINTKEDNAYVFPVLTSKDGPDRIHPRVLNKSKKVNKELKKLAEKLEIKSFTFYSARHTWATLSKRKGIPTAVIQEGLGHKTEEITQAYLDSFGNETVDKYNEMLYEEL